MQTVLRAVEDDAQDQQPWSSRKRELIYTAMPFSALASPPPTELH